MIELENDYIKTWILPQVGGKVWGAIEKASGQEFIYRNEVMKFRNIAMRGPWTSGGIEFNFGILGHTPATATPVDYLLETHEDGSVSCTVGAMDLPSRTQWRVRIKLPKDKAYFETEALWYNPTSLHQSYYNWMTAAASAKEDLEFYCPGDKYITHPGDARPYPMEYERNIAKYRENDFLDSKSYHVVGEYNDFFGGYFQQQQYGFGHWALYDDMPGQKLWIWALSRAGGIWEDLLTNSDGQYIEFQAGRLFNQYAPSENMNPISQATFTPHTTDQWRELWFPVLGIGGLTDVSPNGILHSEYKAGKLIFGVNALATSADVLTIRSGNKIVYEQKINLRPLQFLKDSIAISGDWQITLPKMDLQFNSNPTNLRIARPFHSPDLTAVPSFELNFRAGVEAMEFREYPQAKSLLEACLKDNPAHLEALSHLAELHYIQAEYDKGLQYALTALAIDTYHPQANYVAGILYKAEGDFLNAKEMLGWAARSMNFRTAAYALMGEIALTEQHSDLAIHYATNALDFNRFNVLAHQVLIVAHRLKGENEKAINYANQLLVLDPLCHFARHELYLLKGTDYQQYIQNELPYQTYLELAMDYFNKQQTATAISVLKAAPNHPLVQLWLAYLQKDVNLLKSVLEAPIDFVFPYRNETLQALEWANKVQNHWKLKYYLALNLWSKNRLTEAAELLNTIAQQANEATFYLTRATFNTANAVRALPDLEKALQLAPQRWRVHQAIIQHHQKQQQHEKALIYSSKAVQQFPENYALSMLHVKSLIYQSRYAEAIAQLQKTQVLPFEGAYEGRQLYEWAHYGYALQLIEQQQYPQAITVLEQSKLWQEQLGVGKPFDPDERMADYLLAYIYRKTKQLDLAAKAKTAVVAYTLQFPIKDSYLTALGLKSMDEATRSKTLIHTFPNPSELPIKLRWAVEYYAHNETSESTDDVMLRLVQKALGLE